MPIREPLSVICDVPAYAMAARHLDEVTCAFLIGGRIPKLETKRTAPISEIVISFTATPAVFISSLKAAVVMGIIGGLVPAIRGSRVSPVEAMRA